MFRASCAALARPKPVGSSSRSFASLCLVISICIGTPGRAASDACLRSFLRLGFFACLTLLEIAIAICPPSILGRVTTSQAASAPVTALNCGVTGASDCSKSTNRDIHWQNLAGVTRVTLEKPHSKLRSPAFPRKGTVSAVCPRTPPFATAETVPSVHHYSPYPAGTISSRNCGIDKFLSWVLLYEHRRKGSGWLFKH